MIEKYKSLLEETKRHFEILKKLFFEIEKFANSPLNTKDVERLKANLNTLALLDAIAYRFSKFQEAIGKLLRIYLALQGEEVEALFMRDVINLAEKRNFEINWELWVKFRELRNTLTHDYPQEEEEIAEALNEIKKLLPYFEKIIEKLSNIC